MMKYPVNETVCGAIYDNAPANNPFLAAMPEMLPREQFMEVIRSMSGLPHNLPLMSPEERRQSLNLLASVFIPIEYMYALYYRAIRETYTTRTVVEEIRQINALFCNKETVCSSTQAASGSVPGIGKTSTIRRALAAVPQVIEHIEYMEKPFFCKQILYLCIECPSDCSVKTLALNLVSALDRAIGSSYLQQLTSLRSAATSAIATQVKILCMTHHVCLLLVIGTLMAEQLFISQEHLKRRTQGVRLLPLKLDGTYRKFLEQLWRYQFTQLPAPLTEKLANKLFDFSGGVPAYIIKIFQESQAQVLLQGQAQIGEKIMQLAIDILAIKVPRTYSGRMYISDFDNTDTLSRPPSLRPSEGT